MPPKFRRPPRPPPRDPNAANKDEDDDSFFSRNTKGWSGVDIEAITSPKNQKRQSSSPEFEPSPKKRKSTTSKQTYDWTKPGAVITLDDSNDSDEIEIVGSNQSPGTSKGKGKQRAKAKRERSITPPPQLSKEAIRNALKIAKTTLFGEQPEEQRHISYADVSLQEDRIDVDDDLEVQAILASALRKSDANSFSQNVDTHSPFAETVSPKSPGEDEPPEMTKLKVHWNGEPLADGRDKWNFAFKLDAPFRRLNEMMQAKTGLDEEGLVLVYDGHHIMLGATPQSLRIKKDTSTKIEVYSRANWDAIEAERRALAQASSSNFIDDGDVELTTNDQSHSINQSQDDTGEHDEEDNVLVLNIRSAKYPNPVRIPARKTAVASKILLRYLQKVGEEVAAYDTVGVPRSKLKQIKLSFDGEQIGGNTEVGEVDAEDEDVWDVVGL